MSQGQPISKWRKMFWPIYGEENKKFIPTLLMLALALFNYTSLRITKDALIVTAPHSGAAVLNFLKGFVVLPASFLFVIFYGKMRTAVSRKNLFYVTLLPFLIFFTIFAIIYPFHEAIHMSPKLLSELQEMYPRLKHILPIFAYYTFSAFYVASELWGSVVITLLFWQFANLTTKKDEIKRFYPLFGAYSNIGLIIGGCIQTYQISTELTCALVVSSAAGLGAIYAWFNKNVIDVNECGPSVKKTKVKVGLREGFKLIMQSKYLGYITVLVVAYGLSCNLAEVFWKEKVKELYPAKDAYKAFMGKFFIATGCSTMILGLSLKNVIQRFGWYFAAMITPIVLLVTSMIFFVTALYSKAIFPAHLAMGSIPLIIAVTVGAMQNIASKATKYSLFDPTTQMTYIPLDDNLRVTGKASVDVLGGRMGKSLGGYVQSAALVITGATHMTTIAPLLMVVSVAMISLWMVATRKLSVAYAEKLAENEATEAKQ